MTTTQSLGDVLTQLYDIIEDRRLSDGSDSYTASLLTKGPAHCARKFGEEAVETVIAGAMVDQSALAEEAADSLYHLLVLLASADVTPSDVAAVLQRRAGTSGHDEKAGRA